LTNQVQTPRVVSAKAATFTTRRMDTIVARWFSLGAGLSAVEMFMHAQEQAHLLNPLVFWPTLGFTLATILGMITWSWLRENNNLWYLLHAGSVLLNLALWPLEMKHGVQLPPDFTPYVWWSLGWGVMSAGLGLRRGFAAVYLVLVPLWFAAIQMSPMGGSATLARASQDTVYTLLISAVIVAVVHMLRYRASQQDLAFELASQAAATEAAENAVANERLHVGSLVHNQVLSALNAAISAYSPEDQETAKNLAAGAIVRLGNFEAEVLDGETQIPVAAFFDSLTNLIAQQAPEFSVSTEVEGSFELPVDVTTALSEATMQAVANSLMHAGPKVSKRRVKLRAANSHVKIAIVDDGRGFRVARIPKNRLGIRTLIFKRVKQAGGTPNIQSSPGEGTSVILQWEAE